MQELEPLEEPQEDTEYDISLKCGYESESCLPPDLEWYRAKACNVKSIEYKKTTIIENLNLDYVEMLNKDVDDLRKCFVSRLPRVVSNHIPVNKKS